MPVADIERTTMPRSALRYRPLQSDQAAPGSIALRKHRASPDVQTLPTSILPEGKKENSKPASSSSALRKQTSSAPRKGHRQFHPLFWLGLGVVFCLVLWVGIAQVVTWGTNKINDWRYGYPRVFQMDVVLGHQDSVAHPTHLLVMNLHGEIILEEFPGGDVSKARSYVMTSLVGNGDDLLPVTLRLLQRPGHQPDLVVEVGETFSLLVNNQGSFRAPTPDERQQLLLLLQRSMT